MSYRLNKTDGSLLVELVDGRLDTTSTNLVLIGKNYKGFGEQLNENWIKLLENFANTTQPNKPIRGQLWYDTGAGRLKVFNGSQFVSTDSSIFASSRPTTLVDGDIWIDGTNNQLYFYDGFDTNLVGPIYTKSQGLSGYTVDTVRDTTGQNKNILKFWIANSLIAIISKEAFTPFPAITGFTTINVGFNISSVYSNYKFYGTANAALQLIDNLGNPYDPEDFISANADDQTTGQIKFKNDNGIIVGLDEDFKIGISGNTTVLENTKYSGVSPYDLKIRLKDSGGSYDALYFDANNRRIGILNTSPQYDLDITGDVFISGDLLVQGATTSLEVSTLRVQDKQIELGITDDSTAIDDATADDAGLVVIVDNGDDKRWTWRQATNSWTANQNINLNDITLSYKINSVDVLSQTTLGPTVVNSSLTSIGTLSSLTVDDINLNSNRITSTSGLEISAVGDISLINQQFLTNVKTPVSEFDVVQNPLLTESNDNYVATKGYVDKEILNSLIVMGLDITGLGSGPTLQNNVATVLEELTPAATRPNGTIARIHTSSTTASTDPIDVDSNLSKSFIAVDSAGVQNVSVLQDLSVVDPTTTITFTVTRTIMEYKIVSNTWTYQSTTASAV